MGGEILRGVILPMFPNGGKMAPVVLTLSGKGGIMRFSGVKQFCSRVQQCSFGPGFAQGAAQENPAALSPPFNQCAVHQYRHMARNTRLALSQHLRHFTHRQLHPGQQPHDPQARGIGKGANNAFGWGNCLHGRIAHIKISLYSKTFVQSALPVDDAQAIFKAGSMPIENALQPPPDLPEFEGDEHIALFLDFDGTLVELAPTPDGIAVAAGLASRLGELAERLDDRLALVSGRAIVDLEKHLGPVTLACAGSHGSDCRKASGDPLGDAPGGLASETLTAIREFAKNAGFDLEDKPHGAALHYRANPALEPQGLIFAQDLAAKHNLEVKRGKCVIELVAPGANKGAAVAAFMDEAPFAGAMPIFIGDDVTDEDGFAKAQELGGFGIIVGERLGTAARYRLANVAAVHHWLQL